jgi:hypothetical protein
VGNLGEFFVFLPDALVIALMGRLFLGAGEDWAERNFQVYFVFSS